MRRALTVLILALLLGSQALTAQTNGAPMPTPRQQFFSNAGAPLAGGLLYAYQAGTTTALATYSDAALSSANTQPIVLDASGRATVFLSARAYKFTLRTSAGVEVWTVDNVVGTAPPTSVQSVTTTCTPALTNGRNQTIQVNASSGAVTCQLPTAVGNTGVIFTIKKTDTTTNRVTISTTSAQTIDDSTTQLLTQQYQFLSVTSNGSNWLVTDDAAALRSVYVYGAKCDAATNDTAAFEASIAAQGLAYVPLGRCLINLTIDDSNVRILGQSASTVSPLNSSIRAFNPASPVITIANASADASGVHLDNLAFEASAATGTGTTGLKCGGGCYANMFTNLSFNGFTTYAIHVQADTNRDTSLNFFSQINIVAASSQTAAVYISEPTSGAKHTTTTYVSQARLTMNSGTSGHLLETDSSDVYLSQVHMQCTTTHCLKMTKTYSNTPFVYASNLIIDSDNSADSLLTVYTTTKEVSTYLRGTFLIDGLLVYSDASTLALNNATAPMTTAVRVQRYGWQMQMGASTGVGAGPVVWQSSTSTVANSSTNETDLQSGTLHASAFDVNRIMVACEAFGNYAANGNSKVLRAYIGGSLVHTNTSTTSGGGWYARWWAVRTGTDAQTASGYVASATPSAGQTAAITIDDGATMIFKVTGQGGASSDIVSHHISCYWYPERSFGQN